MDVIKLLILNLFLISLFGCSKVDNVSSEDCLTYDYSDCNTTNPEMAEIKVNFSYSSLHSKIPFKIYKGFIDNGELLKSDTSIYSSLIFYFPNNEYYSVVAEYEVNGKKIQSVDGYEFKKIKTIKCDSSCWTVKSKVLNVDLP